MFALAMTACAPIAEHSVSNAATTNAAAAIIVSPAPGSVTASVSTQISLLGTAALKIHKITVTGSKSGHHAGVMKRYVAEAGESFVSSTPYVAGETVTVHVGSAVAGAENGKYSFVVGTRYFTNDPNTDGAINLNSPALSHFASNPSLVPPTVTALVNHDASDGDFLLAPKGVFGQAGPMIVDSAGNLVWFQPLTNKVAMNLNRRTLHNQPVLTWWQGQVVDGHGIGEDIIDNMKYQTIATIGPANGFAPDLHEFNLLNNGVAFVTSYQALNWNLTSVKALAHGNAWDGIVQEIDVKTGLVMYEWHSLDHVPVTASYDPAPAVVASPFDYFHVNSIQQLDNGDLLISARDTDAAYEVAPSQAGAIVWQLGGKASSFTMGPGSVFHFQHDVEETSPGVITIFDDEGFPAVGPQAKALVLRINTASKTATLVKAYVHPTPAISNALGSMQTLSNGDQVVGWGTAVYLSQFTAGGTLVNDLRLPNGDDTYRVYRQTVTATPVTPVSIAVTSHTASALHVAVSWNGATTVAKWRFLTGSTASRLSASSTVAKVGFETTAVLTSSDPYVEVQALNAAGKVIGKSAAVHVG